MGGLIMQFSVTLSATNTFDIPDQFGTASVCPVAGSSGSYNIQPLVESSPIGTVSPTLLDITSFPEGTRPWCSHRITCVAGSVIVKYQSKSV